MNGRYEKNVIWRRENYLRAKYWHTYNIVLLPLGYFCLTGLRECLNQVECNLYLETPVYLIHMSNEVLEKFKEYIQLVCKVSSFLKSV